MMGMVFLCLLAGIGLMSIRWAALGWLLPDLEGAVFVCAGIPREENLIRYRWLRGLGLLGCPLVIVTEENPWAIPEDTVLCTGENLLSRLEQEWKNCHGTGTGDSSGHHWCSGISEL